ncbi:DUF1837 domain-containing protein [Lachnotalea glycerini]|uniref:DUF1837 domain-containing protein n=1 Tax=Lachnotalea glycerini TaxID=1763509 RepID=A0A371JBA5_9FIRM|nr:DUF1837 domain-containing protein [Lachnotalea glycerini]RDY30003.1 DUF1837 domain-containing protein [Lachnotalea glycerini]
MELSLKESEFLSSFDLLWSKDLDKYKKNKLNLFVLKINSNEFDYDLLVDMLLDPVIDYSISRQVKEKYKNRPGTLSQKAREKFVDYTRNNGELGELLLFCFLETHLGAPKILTKLELKTSTSHYVNGADGVHFLKLPDGNYQLIFGESKTYKNIDGAISDAFKSIYNFKNGINEKGNEKSGLQYEKSLISDNLFKEAFSEEEREFLESIIYPTKRRKFDVDDAFGIFIGFQINVNDDEMAMPTSEFRKMIKTVVDKEVSKYFAYIQKKITDLKLQGHNFYIYVLPFTDIDTKRKRIMEAITK